MRITKEQLEIYRKYGGDEDGLARAGTVQEKVMFGSTDWQRITALVQALALASSPFASDEYKSNTLAAVHRECHDIEAEQVLRSLAH
jgi:hypothetical protein